MNNMKYINKKAISLAIIITFVLSSLQTVIAADIPNWKSLYQSKVQQIESEYSQEKRTKDNEYNIAFYSLQDIDFDGVPELYHTLIAQKKNGYELQEGTEEIYYIKNNRVVLGKIESHNTLGLLPSFVSKGTLADRNWQFAMYNHASKQVSFMTKESWSDNKNRGKVIFTELFFDQSKGTLKAKEISSSEYNLGSEPTELSGYQAVADATTHSASKSIDTDMWEWTPPYVIAEEKETNNTNKTDTNKQKTWIESYKEFVVDKGYKKTSQQFHTKNENEIRFALFELSGDDIPELIVKNGASVDNEKANYIYAYSNSKVSYVGKAGTLSSDFQIVDDHGYEGLYWESGTGGKFKGYFYNIKNGKINEQGILEKNVKYINGRIDSSVKQITSDDELYEACRTSEEKMQMYNNNEIQSIGWSKFCGKAAEESSLYKDVIMDSWYYDAVKFATEKKLMSGVSNTRFEPESEITRAMFITILYRLEREPSTSRVNFKDVEKGSWYENAVSWASRKDIANGVTNDLFAPDDKITREQLMTILYRYAKFKGKSITTNEYNIKSFIDNNTISDYAVTPMNWAVGNGFVSGTSPVLIEPNGNATRAQAAVILQRFCEKYKL